MSDASAQPVALVTGATRGLGKACALGLARAGFLVVVTGRTLHEGEGRDDDAKGTELPGSIERTVREIEEAGGSALGVQLDIGDRDSIDAAIDTVLTRTGRIDVLLNNALSGGPTTQMPLLEFTMEEADTAFAGTVINQIHITRRVLPSMIAQGSGRIIFMSSASSVLTPHAKPPKGGWGVLYASTKAAMNRVSDFVHLEHFDDGVRSFLIHPAFTFTDTMAARYGGKVPDFGSDQEVNTPDQIADVVVWLATSPDADRYSGARMFSAPHFFEKEGIDPSAV